MQPLLRNSDAWLRVHSEVVLARLSAPSADAALLGELDNLPSDWLPAVARFVARLSDTAVRTRLRTELARRETGTHPDAAVAAYQRALRRHPGSFRAHGNLAMAYGQLGALESVRAHLAVARTLQPGHPKLAEMAQRLAELAHLDSPLPRPCGRAQAAQQRCGGAAFEVTMLL